MYVASCGRFRLWSAPAAQNYGIRNVLSILHSIIGAGGRRINLACAEGHRTGGRDQSHDTASGYLLQFPANIDRCGDDGFAAVAVGIISANPADHKGVNDA